MPEFEPLTQADFTLDACGRPRVPQESMALVPIPKSFVVQFVFPASTTSPTQQVWKEITGDTNFHLLGLQITSSAATAISVQVLLPNGKFLSSAIQDVTQIAGYGSYRYTFTEELVCPPGSKVQVTFQVTNTAAQQPIAMCFDGYYAYLLKGSGARRTCPVDEQAANLPRYFRNPNQNIFAAPWQAGASSPTPEGFEDEDYVYSALGPASTSFPAGAPGSTISVTAANVTATQSIGLDNAEFHVLRVLVLISADNTVTAGSVLARIRAGSGYALFDDYFDAARYVGSCSMPGEWVLQPNDAVYADLQLVDQAGTGNVYWTMFLEGFKRRRKGVA